MAITPITPLWFTHHTKKGKVLTGKAHPLVQRETCFLSILGDVKSSGFTIGQIIMDYDTSANAIVKCRLNAENFSDPSCCGSSGACLDCM